MIDRRFPGGGLLVAVLLAGCAGGGGATISPDASPAMDPRSSAAATSSPPAPADGPRDTPAETGSQAPGGAVLDRPWATAMLTDVTTGETFRVADIVAGGSVVFLETMAIWCTNCRVQQTAAVAALAQLDPARVEWIGVDVESSETADALARYSEQNGFPFRYVIADVGLARALVEDFGDIVLSPPSVNVIVIGTDGRVTQSSGQHSAEELVAIAVEHGA
jgi:thiol-disulfide isomerase/thioredoxin